MRRSRGFSLLEMLVVLLIVGLFSALGVAFLDAGQAPMRQALAQLANEARSQAAQARHAGQLLGLRWNGRSPEFVRWQAGRGRLGGGSSPRAARPGRPACNLTGP